MFVIQNPTTEIEKIAVFLNVKNSTEFYSKVAESCSFRKKNYKKKKCPNNKKEIYNDKYKHT
jgi:hypothetical protein